MLHINSIKLNLKIIFIAIILIIISTHMANEVYSAQYTSANNDIDNLNNPDNSKAADKIIKELYARYAVVMDGSNLRVLAGKNENTPVPMASTTKIMTCIIALENAPTDIMCTTSAYAAGMPDVQLNAKKGEIFSLNDLLYSLMLKSHNDSAVIIAENVTYNYLFNLKNNQINNQAVIPLEINLLDYSFVPFDKFDTSFIAGLNSDQSRLLVSLFAKLMNYKALKLGCTETYFITPNGLDAADNNKIHQTTARELAIIMAYCIKNEDFLKITSTPSYSFDRFSFNNANAFLNMYDNVISGKTGFTADAGYCYVCAYKCEGRTFIVTLLACGWPNNKNYKWHDARLLLNYARDNYYKKNILEKTYPLPEIPVTNGLSSTVKVSVTKPVSLLMSDNEKLALEPELPSVLSAPINKNETVGYINIYINDLLYDAVPINSLEDIRHKDFNYYSFKLIKKFLFIDK